MPKTKRGFTLIELLVVIAIISIIAAILFPVFAQAREKAREITCVSNARQVGIGVQMYLQDNDETMPIFYAYNSAPPSGVPGHVGVELEVMPYLQNKDVFRCPDDAGSPFLAQNTSANGGCSDYPGRTTYHACYGSSYRFTSDMYSVVAGVSSQNNVLYTTTQMVTDAMIQFPSETRIMRDEMFPWFSAQGDPGGAKYGYVPPGSGGVDYYEPWHPRGGTVIFADGHAKFLTSELVFDNTAVTPDGHTFSQGYWGGYD